MTASLSLQFVSGDEPFPELRIHRLFYTDELNDTYSLVIELGSSDPAVDPRSVVGQEAVLILEGEPWLRDLRGIVHRFRQRSSVVTEGGGTSLYELTISPPPWLLSQSSGRRIHQDRSSLDVIQATIAAHGGRVPPAKSRVTGPKAIREYCAQYEETDHELIQRLLADEAYLAFFDPTDAGTWTITDDPRVGCPVLPMPVAFRPPTDLVSTAPHVVGLSARDEITTAEVSLRDYDEEHPQLARSAPYGLAGTAKVASPFPKETAAREALSIGRFSSAEQGRTEAQRELAGIQSAASAITCELNFAVSAGTRFVVTDHARSDLTGELLVIGARFSIDDGVSDDPSGPPRSPSRTYEATCVRADSGFVKPRIPKPNVTATEPAFVVGDTGEGTVDVDSEGRCSSSYCGIAGIVAAETRPAECAFRKLGPGRTSA